MKNTTVTFMAAKGREKLTMLTAYDYSIARLMADCGINALLVGDSLGMVMLGDDDTLRVSLDDMVRHCAAVARGAGDCLVVCDMPWLSYHISEAEAVRNAGRLVREGGAQAVKLEGGMDFVPTVRALVRASIPVMGHLGLTPQSVNTLGGYRVQGKTQAQAQKLLDDARALQDAGAFALVLECVPAPLAARVTRELAIPTIGIGAGVDCDGQVLVWQDMLGLTSKTPKFVRQFAPVGEVMRQAFKDYAAAVHEGAFPAAEHCYPLVGADDILDKLY